MIQTKARKELIIFVVFVLGVTLLLNLTDQTIWVALAQITPFIAVLVLMLVSPNRREIWRCTGMGRLGSWKDYGMALLFCIPLIVSFLVAWALGQMGLPPVEQLHAYHFATQWDRFLAMLKGYFSPQFLLAPLLFAWAEEIGWRGYLQTRLQQRFSQTKAIVYTAIVWAIFHYPFYLNDYNEDGHVWVNILLFTVMIFPLSFLMGWLRMKSESLWPVVFFHGMINHLRMFGENVLRSHEEGWTVTAGENGWVTIVGWSMLAILLWRGRHRHRQESED
jgi:membrane protease YdiL (CAAX protease family)